MKFILLLVTLLTALTLTDVFASNPPPAPPPAITSPTGGTVPSGPAAPGTASTTADQQVTGGAGASTRIPSPVKALVNFEGWMKSIGTIVDAAGLRAKFAYIALAIFALGVFLLAFDFVRYGAMEGLQYGLVRLVICGALLSISNDWSSIRNNVSSGPIQLERPVTGSPLDSATFTIPDLFKNLWHAGFSSSSQATEQVMATAMGQLQQSGTNQQLTQMYMSMFDEKGQAVLRKNGVDEKTTQTSISDGLVPIMMIVSGVLMVLLSGVYSFVLFFSILTILFGKLLCPIVFAMLILPGNIGVDWVNRWVKSMATAAMTAFFLPLMFCLAAFVAVTTPLQQMDASMQYLQVMGNYMNGANTADPASTDLTQLGKQTQDALSAWDFGGFWQGLLKITVLLLIAIFGSLMGFKFAQEILMKTGESIGGFIGGLTIGGGHALGQPLSRFVNSVWGGATGAMAAGAGAIAGGGRQVAGAAAGAGGKAMAMTGAGMASAGALQSANANPMGGGMQAMGNMMSRAGTAIGSHAESRFAAVGAIGAGGRALGAMAGSAPGAMSTAAVGAGLAASVAGNALSAPARAAMAGGGYEGAQQQRQTTRAMAYAQRGALSAPGGSGMSGQGLNGVAASVSSGGAISPQRMAAPPQMGAANVSSVGNSARVPWSRSNARDLNAPNGFSKYSAAANRIPSGGGQAGGTSYGTSPAASGGGIPAGGAQVGGSTSPTGYNTASGTASPNVPSAAVMAMSGNGSANGQASGVNARLESTANRVPTSSNVRVK